MTLCQHKSWWDHDHLNFKSASEKLSFLTYWRETFVSILVSKEDTMLLEKARIRLILCEYWSLFGKQYRHPIPGICFTCSEITLLSTSYKLHGKLLWHWLLRFRSPWVRRKPLDTTFFLSPLPLFVLHNRQCSGNERTFSATYKRWNRTCRSWETVWNPFLVGITVTVEF